MVKIIVDCFGGDNSPSANVAGALLALKEFNDISLLLVGNEDLIKEELKDKEYDKERLAILDAKEVIHCDESPTMATFRKKESSLMKSLTTLKEDDSYAGLVSLSSTGALLVGSVVKIGKIDGVIRPACLPILPTMNHDIVGVMDSGANVDCSKEELLQWAILGSTFLKCAYKKESPRVALLNIGVEEIKGDNLHKETYPLLKECKEINFVGNMESRDAISGNYDLIVSDGFSGNVLIKSIEGTSLEFLKMLRDTFYKNLKNKIGALLLKKDIYEIKDFMNPHNYGGALLLGLNKIVVKGHGNSKEVSVKMCIKQVYDAYKGGFIDEVKEKMKNLKTEEEKKE